VPLAKINAARAIDPWPVAAHQPVARSAAWRIPLTALFRIHVLVFVMFVSKRGTI
jgi:hypothetical protein